MITVIVPTYNEVDNVEPLTRRLLDLGLEMTILFVDDSSPDGTSPKVREVATRHPEVHLLERLGKGGRGGACMAGFQWCVDRGIAENDVIVEMDADLSHAPEDLPAFLEKIHSGADLVVGSRYLPGGRIENWPWTRTWLSIIANRWAKFVLSMPLTDYTTGYRAYRGSVFSHFQWHEIQARGYIVLTEMAWQLHHRGCVLAEVPIVFVNRVRGESNLSIGEIVSAFTSVLRLRGNLSSPPATPSADPDNERLDPPA